MPRTNSSGTRLLLLSTCALAIMFAVGCRGVSTAPVQVGSDSITVTVTVTNPATGTIVSAPAGINCPGTCSANFDSGTQVVLTETPGAPSTFSIFGGWSGACTGSTTTCTVMVSGTEAVTATFNPAINHIVFLAQENRSFDHYFGELRKYWADNSYSDQAFDGLPQFNPPFGSSPPPTNPPCANPDPTTYCAADPNGTPVTSDHLPTVCIENPSPSWNESHVDWAYNDPAGNSPAALDGFVQTAANDARQNVPPFLDTNGYRAMGYYDGGNPSDPTDPGDLNFYYFMASNFGTSDRWFSPTMSRTQPNRMFMMAGTAQGHAYPLGGTDPYDQQQLTAPPIFQALQNAGITWRIYVQPDPEAIGDCAPNEATPHCLYVVSGSYLQMFTYGATVINDPTLSQNLVPMSQFATDAANGTLPQVAWLESPTDAGLDEHPSVDDSAPINVQAGAAFVETQMKALMGGKSWSDSVMIFTYDEGGGLYDHVSPQPMPSPDGITPQDLRPGDICNGNGGTGPTCDFVFTGYRVPMFVISPYAKKNYVSHTIADTTAVLKLIETRFGLSALTKRDVVQFDMTEFFDFVGVPWATPPSNIPQQNRGGTCSLNPPPP